MKIGAIAFMVLLAGSIAISHAQTSIPSTPPNRAQDENDQSPPPSQQQIRDEAGSLTRDMDDPSFDFSTFPDRLRKVMTDMRRYSDSVDREVADQFRRELMMNAMPVIARHRTQIEEAMQTAFVKDLQKPLGCSDEEFAAIRPSIVAVVKAQMVLSPRPRGGPFAQMNSQPPQSPAEQAVRDLQDVVKDETSVPEVIRTKLEALRQLRLKAKDELKKAREELRGLLTVRQEAVLVENGILD